MRAARAWQDAGHERPLSLGEEYDLPAPVAETLIADGVAEAVSSRRPPETKPELAYETKRGKGR
jgi:hypothetical protein